MKDKQKVLMIGLTPPEEGGSQRHIYEIAERIGEVTVLTQSGSSCTRKIELPVLHTSPFIRNITFFISCLFYSIKLILVKKHDIIHIHENLLYILIPILKLRYNVIVTVHGITGFKFYDNKILWKIFGNSLKCADHLIAVSLEDEKLLKKEFKNLSYLPNGADLSIYNKISPKIEKKITFIGRVHEQKGIIYLLEAFDSIKDKIPGYNLEIIGKVNDYALALQEKYPDKRIIWKGFVSDRRSIVKSLKSAYCITLPSLWEGLPLTLFEALASGRPVILSDITVFKNITKDSAIYCKVKSSKDLANKLLLLINDNKKAQHLGNKGKILSKSYDWQSIAGSTFKIYQELDKK